MLQKARHDLAIDTSFEIDDQRCTKEHDDQFSQHHDEQADTQKRQDRGHLIWYHLVYYYFGQDRHCQSEELQQEGSANKLYQYHRCLLDILRHVGTQRDTRTTRATRKVNA